MSRRTRSRHGRIYNHRPDNPDIRDIAYRPKAVLAEAKIQQSVDLTDKLPACWDQGNLGACTGHGSVGALVYAHPNEMFSRLDAYYNGRVIEGDVDEDNGAQIRDVVAGLVSPGVVLESVWPYDINTFTTPPVDLQGAPITAVSQYLRVNDLDDLKQCLAEGFPVIFGFTVYDNFESDQTAETGVLNLPGPNDQMLGGHCVLAIGYSESTRQVKVRNSWGTSWGPFNGNFFMAYDYFQSLVSDLWTIRQ